jgi:prepilin-type N-terminal cleavage/methylation domain-containing protein
MLSNLKKSEQGFTIIEVLIVLAIAGLILLIVFLAVPALQRNARNTNRKTDASAVLAAVSEYEDNNSGALPTGDTYAAGTGITLCNTAGCAASTSANSIAKLGYYTGVAAAPTTGDVTIYTAYTAAPAAPGDELIIDEGASCNGNTVQNANNTRAFAALYGVEASGAYAWQCVAS